MSSFLFGLPEYNRALGEFVDTALVELVNRRNELLASIPTHRGEQIPRSRNTLPSGQVVEGESLEYKIEFPLDLKEVIRGNTEDFIATLDTVAEQKSKIQTKHFLSYVSRLCEATGNQVDMKGQPLSYDSIISMLDTGEMQFDENGEPEIPSAFLHLFHDPREECNCFSNPQRDHIAFVNSAGQILKRIEFPLPPTETQIKTYDELIKRKRREHNDRKRSRKLS